MAVAVIHVDADCFFLSVHARDDPRIRETPTTTPIALFQYNDVICCSSAARALGLRKHVSPQEARELLAPAGGRVMHAYWRDWPGPRTWYAPYQAASRELFAALRAAVDATPAAGAVIERGSIDEAFIQITAAAAAAAGMADALALADMVARTLPAAIASAVNLPVCCGVAPNKLLAKLATTRAKAPAGAAGAAGETRVWSVRCDADAEALLGATAAAKLPGLGSKGDALLARAGVRTALELRRLSVPELQALGLSAAAAELAHARCRGVDPSAVADVPPKSCSVTSWLAFDLISDLARKEHAGRGGPAVVVGGWLFEPHATRERTNSSRARWLLLALCLDLEEKIAHHVLAFGEAPTKLTLGWQGCGTLVTPGPGHRAGPTHARTVGLDGLAIFGRVRPGGAARRGVPFLQSAHAAEEMLSPETLVVEAEAAGCRLHAGDEYGGRVAALVQAAAAALAAWACELPPNQRIAQIELRAHGFVMRGGSVQRGGRLVTSPPQQQPTIFAMFQSERRQREGAGNRGCVARGALADSEEAQRDEVGASGAGASVEAGGGARFAIEPWDEWEEEGEEDEETVALEEAGEGFSGAEEDGRPEEGRLPPQGAWPSEGSSGASWPCERCTLINALACTSCVVCEAPRPQRPSSPKPQQHHTAASPPPPPPKRVRA